ncbi:hypothetical protein MAR_022859 [Mya arenaria]|uniref:Uncharacterized protein n=1 Tax=Mya arenaria TaxID=6604 RepID=A0ABY7DNH1_MYAAR|nr:hypothetical protein MAR_022859 [Mya arenaria]
MHRHRPFKTSLFQTHTVRHRKHFNKTTMLKYHRIKLQYPLHLTSKLVHNTALSHWGRLQNR